MTPLGGRQAAGLIVGVAVGLALALIVILPGLQGSIPAPSGTGPPSASPRATAAATATGSATATGGAGPTQPTAGAPVVLVGAGDIAVCGSDGDTATAALLDGIEGAVFALGDNAYENGTLDEYERCFAPTWGRHFDRIWPTPGNHEYNTAGASGYFAYFGARAGDPARGYYAYDLGAWRIYSLNSNCTFVACGEASAQLAWLREDLSASPRQCALAYWHHPRYSSGRHGNDPATGALWKALYDAGAEIVMAGHDHLYERFAPMDGDGDLDPGRGIVSFVAGTGGRGLYEFHDIASTSRVRDAETWGVLELTLSAGAWSSRFVPVAGRSFTDAAGGTCH